MYAKSLPIIIGDGDSMLGELIAAAHGKGWTGMPLGDFLEDVEQSRPITDIPVRNEVVRIGWRHNLAQGARAELLDPESPRLRPIVDIAISAACALGVVFAAVDVADILGEYKVLEVNTGIVTNHLLNQVPSASPIVRDLYGAVVEFLFQVV